MSPSDTELRRKRLAHRSRYRGFLESDIIFRRFVEEVLPRLDDADLDRFEALIDEPDQDVYAWVIGTAPIPARHNHEVMASLRAMRDRPSHPPTS